jgi:RNA polymerase sigma-70 factor, ECF subfamily
MMKDKADGVDEALERFRAYLSFQIRKIVDPRLKNQLDLSGIVSQSLVEAWRTMERISGWNEQQKRAWLNTILERNLRDELDKVHAACRDIRRQRSLEEAVADSSARLVHVLVADQSTPSEHVAHQQQDLRLAEAIERLPVDQREALVLQRWHQWSLAQIAEHLGRSQPAVAGLLHRALKQLKEELREAE